MTDSSFNSSAADRPIRMEMRADLVVRKLAFQGREDLLIKDPVALRHHRFPDEAYFILTQLDGKTSAEEIRQRYEARFAPEQISFSEIYQLIGSLHRANLVTSDAPDQGDKLMARADEQWRREWMATLSNVLCIRLPGFDPDRMLGVMTRYLGWFFSMAMVITVLCGGLSAIMLVCVNFDQFRAKLPEFQEFFAMGNWLSMAMALVLIKITHEFGHGIACKRFGGECHEMGVMFLVFTPCLYCDTTDSWMLRSKWQRAGVGLAGIYVEFFLATVATFVWWTSTPGLIHYTSLNVMFVASVGTLLFNGNPLLRYDGYYVLSDLLEIPNLRQKATGLFKQMATAVFLRRQETEDPFLPTRHRGLFISYAFASVAYRWLITISIMWFLYRIFEPYGLQVFGKMLITMVLLSLVGRPLYQGARYLVTPGRMDEMKKIRLAAAAGVIALILLGIAMIPLPHHVECRFKIEPDGADSVYVNAPGQLVVISAVPGEQVTAGEPIVTLVNPDMQVELTKLQAERCRCVVRLDELRRRWLHDESAGATIPRLEETILTLDEQIRQKREDLAGLQITAPSDGEVLAAHAVVEKNDGLRRLKQWSGSPLETKNIGATLGSGVLVCRVGNPNKLEAVVEVDQSEVEFLQPGQEVKLQWDGMPGVVMKSSIQHVARLQTDPDNMASDNAGSSASDSHNNQHSSYNAAPGVYYRASAPLASAPCRIPVGAYGRARVHVGYRTVANRVWRELSRTFTFM